MKKKTKNQRGKDKNVQNIDSCWVKNAKKKQTKMCSKWMGNFIQNADGLLLLFFKDEVLVDSEKKYSDPTNFLSPLPPNQKPFPPIFSLIFHSSFSILPKITPTKHTLKKLRLAPCQCPPIM